MEGERSGMGKRKMFDEEKNQEEWEGAGKEKK